MGLLGVNCYIFWRDGRTEALAVDPGDDGDEILACLDQAGLTLTGILLTHGHVDHIGAIPALVARFPVPVYMHELERERFLSPENQLLPWLPAIRDLPQPATEMPVLQGVSIDILHTPGHSPGSVCYYLPDDGVLFSGDTLFAGSIGRTDFTGGDPRAMKCSLEQLLCPLPDQTKVYPRHQDSTTIGHEKKTNIFMRG